MIKAWDADGHVSESEVTFSDKYWDPKLKDGRPRIIERARTVRSIRSRAAFSTPPGGRIQRNNSRLA